MREVLAVLVLLAMGMATGWAFVVGLDREMDNREAQAIRWRVEMCGETYADRYADAIRRAGLIGGYIVHEPDCRVWVAAADPEAAL